MGTELDELRLHRLSGQIFRLLSVRLRNRGGSSLNLFPVIGSGRYLKLASVPEPIVSLV